MELERGKIYVAGVMALLLLAGAFVALDLRAAILAVVMLLFLAGALGLLRLADRGVDRFMKWAEERDRRAGRA